MAVNRTQSLRSSTAKARPSGRLPGELYTNWPDKQIGVIDSTGTAMDLVAVRFFSTTTSYVAGDYVIQGGKLYVAKGPVPAGAFTASQWSLSGGAVTVSDTAPSAPDAGTLWWDSVGGQLYLSFQDANSQQWVPASNVVTSLPIASTSVLGAVKVDGTSIQAAGDGTISTVLVPMGDNRIINGDMRIDQRNNGASGTAVGYTIDRWLYDATQPAKGSYLRNTFGPPPFPYYLAFASSSAYTITASDVFGFRQIIEADMISDFAWGTTSAQPVTLSFWAYSSLTGLFGGSIRNAATTRSYPFSYSIPVANIWTKIVITIPGDTTGTWVLNGNAAGMHLAFGFGVGATYSGPAGAWASANYVSVTGAVSVVGTNAASFILTGVKLEIGSIATPFNRQSLAKSLADCQRYYQTGHVSVYGYQAASGTVGVANPWPVVMRAAPTVVHSGATFINSSAMNGPTSVTAVGYIPNCIATATGNTAFEANFTASAEL